MPAGGMRWIFFGFFGERVTQWGVRVMAGAERLNGRAAERTAHRGAHGAHRSVDLCGGGEGGSETPPYF